MASPDTQSPTESNAAPTGATDDATTEAPPSYVKLAMRNMVKKGGKSLQHFGLTVSALLGVFVALAYLTR